MKPAARALLIGCGSVAALGLAFALALVFWFRGHGDELMARGKAAQAAGTSAGTSLADAQCVDTALADYKRDRGLLGAVQARRWLSGCLGTARATEAFCTGTPAKDRIMASATWRMAVCDEHGLGGDSTCPNILAEVQEHCEARAGGPGGPNP